MAVLKWTGVIDGNTFRVVDLGAGQNPRVVVEMREQPDTMGGMGWQRYDPIPTTVFSQMLIASGVVT